MFEFSEGLGRKIMSSILITANSTQLNVIIITQMLSWIGLGTFKQFTVSGKVKRTEP